MRVRWKHNVWVIWQLRYDCVVAKIVLRVNKISIMCTQTCYKIIKNTIVKLKIFFNSFTVQLSFFS